MPLLPALSALALAGWFASCPGDGTCSGRGLRLLTSDECEAAARRAEHQFIGRTTERGEFPGCVRWGGGFVEFNAHADEAGGCRISGEAVDGVPPACLCVK